MLKKIKNNLIVVLILSVFLGIFLGLVLNRPLIHILMELKHIVGQFIVFCVPLIILGFITPSITGLQENASRMLRDVIIIAYLSSVGAAAFSMLAGYLIIPRLHIISNPAGLRQLPELVLQLDIPQIMPVMTALVLAIILGLTIEIGRAHV